MWIIMKDCKAHLRRAKPLMVQYHTHQVQASGLPSFRGKVQSPLVFRGESHGEPLVVLAVPINLSGLWLFKKGSDVFSMVLWLPSKPTAHAPVPCAYCPAAPARAMSGPEQAVDARENTVFQRSFDMCPHLSPITKSHMRPVITGKR